MIPGHNTQYQGASNFSEGFPPFVAFPRGAPGMSWSDNAGSESGGQAAYTFAPQSTPLPPFGFDFMAMQAMMAQMTLNPSPVEAAASIPQTAGFAQTWSLHPQAVAQPGSSAHQQAQVNPSNVCSTLRNILMNFARRNAPGGQGKPKASMKRVPTSDAAFLSVGWTLDANPEIILELAKDPVGSRYVQFRYTHTTSAHERDSIARILLSDFKACAKHACGNYTVQCLLSDSHHAYVAQALLCVLADIDLYATNVYGHRVVQRALDVAREPVWNKLAQGIVRNIAAYTTHQCAHNVVQKLLAICAEKRVIPPQVLEFLAGNAVSLASHPYGCRVLQKTMEVMPQSWLAKSIFPSLLPLALSLATNPYGNFVLQRMIPAEADQIFRHFRGSIVQTSQHKYASNVLEKLVSEAPESSAATIVSEIIGCPIPAAKSPKIQEPIETTSNYVHVSGFWLAHPTVARAGPVRQLLIDRYANYVLQKALRTAPMHVRVVLADAVRVNADQIEGLPYGRQMLQEAISVLISVGIMVPVQSGGGYPAHVLADPAPAVAAGASSHTGGDLKSQVSTAEHGISHGFGGPQAAPGAQSSLSFQSASSWMSPWDNATHGDTLQPLSGTSAISEYGRSVHPAARGLQSLASAASDPAASSAHEASAAHKCA